MISFIGGQPFDLGSMSSEAESVGCGLNIQDLWCGSAAT
jgi:hypothetical protein